MQKMYIMGYANEKNCWTEMPYPPKKQPRVNIWYLQSNLSMYAYADRPLECELIHMFYRLRNGSLTEMQMFYFQHNIFQFFL